MYMDGSCTLTSTSAIALPNNYTANILTDMIVQRLRHVHVPVNAKGKNRRTTFLSEKLDKLTSLLSVATNVKLGALSPFFKTIVLKFNCFVVLKVMRINLL